jgi:hypothetical protein
MYNHTTTIRAATNADAAKLTRLSHGATTRRLRGHVLVAEHDADLIAAIDLISGAVLADPSHRDDGALQLLKGSRYQVLRQSGGVGCAWSQMRRMVPAPTAVATACQASVNCV